ncbi:pyridoxamine 5'-phosphate oxidase family protein [Erwinia pyri]|uniref:Pyridoxamine 5'-phosphate oxidase family protein n=1 Tax=Erwinia pyri TaxID=3062598 RepID=A0AA50HSG2_9GAMM|nr:pyridoxamine 5'-phosphate oxidase family protein [Erwinia sp. DE2]WLS80678.1 pyridoxamine 5'-phosphate oxidase family protein [Erwinia sp. DE2]
MFHPGEKRAQQRAGYGEVRAAVYPAMPEQHRQFFAGLHTFYLATLGEDGYPVAALLQGEPGFISSAGADLLRVTQASLQASPLLPVLKTGMATGGLGIDFSNRRRNRVNGVVQAVEKEYVEIQVQESIGNCPKYIQRRLLPYSAGKGLVEIERLAALDAAARYALYAADTFFVASVAPRQAEAGGVDISHRGGVPGFLSLERGKLKIPDYVGNRYMNTLGNLLVDPRCALLIPDFQQGAALHIQGKAEIAWQRGEGLTERFWFVEIEKIWRIRQLFPPAGLEVEFADSSVAAG